MPIKFLTSKKGSTLAMVLTVLTILSILGVAILSLSLTNYKLAISDRNAKTNFYVSEAGLNEAYAIIQEEIERAIDYGKENINNTKNTYNLDSFLTDERKKDPDKQTSNYVYLNDENQTVNGTVIHIYKGTVKDQGVKLIVNKLFTYGFINYLNADTNLKARLNDLENQFTTIEVSPTDKRKVTGINVSFIKSFNSINNPYTDAIDGLDQMVIEFESTVKKENQPTKILSTKITINIPTYDQTIKYNNEVLTVKKNALFSKAIIAEKNIIVRSKGSDGGVIINGDVYAHGEDLSPEKIATSGIIVGEPENIDEPSVVGHNATPGKLTVNGNVFTGGYFKTGYNDSEINLNPSLEGKISQIFCNTLSIDDGPNDLAPYSGSKINISGDVNTEDDIELNGVKSLINIEGNYYGFSDGTGDVTNQQSSSIVINSDDVGDEDNNGNITGSRISITGAGVPASSTVPSGVYIRGTVFISDPNYQTGESVSVKGNYLAYSQELDGTGDPVFDSYYDKANINFADLPPLVLADSFILDEKGNLNRKLTAQEKAKYFVYASKQTEGIINLGGSKGNGISISHINFSTGAFISNNTATGASPNIDPTINNGLDNKKREYDYYINKIGDPQISQENLYSQSYDLSGQAQISHYFSFPDTENTIDSFINKEILYAGSSDIHIKGKDSNLDVPGAKQYVLGLENEAQGIIVTKGDVYISGNVDFTGTIITEKNVYFIDDLPKKITNDYNEAITPNTDSKTNYVIKTIFEQMQSPNVLNTIAGHFIATGTSEINGLLTMNTGTDNIDNTNTKKYSDLVKVSSWRKIK